MQIVTQRVGKASQQRPFSSLIANLNKALVKPTMFKVKSDEDHTLKDCSDIEEDETPTNVEVGHEMLMQSNNEAMETESDE